MAWLYSARLNNTRNGNESFLDWSPLITKLIPGSGYGHSCWQVPSAEWRALHREPELDAGFGFWPFRQDLRIDPLDSPRHRELREALVR